MAPDPQLSQWYQFTQDVDSPAHVDQAILAAATRAVGGRPGLRTVEGKVLEDAHEKGISGQSRQPRGSWSAKFKVPMAIAATAVLSVSVVTMMRDENPDVLEPAKAVPQVTQPALPARVTTPEPAVASPPAAAAAASARDVVKPSTGPSAAPATPAGTVTPPPVLADKVTKPVIEAAPASRQQKDAEAAADSRGPQAFPGAVNAYREKTAPATAPAAAPAPDMPSVAQELLKKLPDADKLIDQENRRVTSAPKAEAKTETKADSKAGTPQEAVRMRSAPRPAAAATGEPAAAAPGAPAALPSPPPAAFAPAPPVPRPVPPARVQESGVSAAPAAPAAQPAAPDTRAEQPIFRSVPRAYENDPDAWIKRILEMKRTGSEDTARADLARFVKRYPAYPLPAELQGWVPPQ
jgi:hypothetical protein